MALPLYALTLFVSAFILFLVQPIVGKIILPKLGGTPQVWNTCMVFFQMVLLAGYAYTHNATARLTLRQQLLAHGVLLLLPLIILLPFPFAFGGEYLDPSSGEITAVSNANPTVDIKRTEWKLNWPDGWSEANTTPIEITAKGHKLETGMRVKIADVETVDDEELRRFWKQSNPTEADKFDEAKAVAAYLKSEKRKEVLKAAKGQSAAADGVWTITKIDDDRFSLDGSRSIGTYVTGGTFAGGTPNPHSLWGFLPVLGANPIPSTLAILFLYVALPFVVVATSAPLLQKWFVHTGHPAAKDPYFLYGASNFGSMLSLIIYPILVEPYTRLKEQGWIYTGGYLGLIVFVMVCAVTVWNSKEAAAKPKPATPEPPKPEPAPAAAQATAAAATGVAAPQTGITASAPAPAAPVAPAAPSAATAVKPGAPPAKTPAGKGGGKPYGAADPSIKLPSDDMSMARRLRWVLLAAIPSSLMLGITTHITTDLSPQPMFWLVPLILYLASFIFVFARWPVVWTEAPHTFFVYAQPFCIATMILVDVLHLTSDTRFLLFAMFAHVLGFFTTTMVCHGELAKDRPSTKHLTEFYLLMSVGGMLGGMFNALLAPVVFQWGIWEFPLCIFAAGLARPRMFETGLFDNFLGAIFDSQAEAPAHGKAGHKGAKQSIAVPAGTANESLVQILDFAWPALILVCVLGLGFVLDKPDSTVGLKLVAYLVPLALCCLCLARPLRFGLGIGAVLAVWLIVQFVNDSATIKYSRSYFGQVSVKQFGTGDQAYRQLIHGHIDHGMNFVRPEKGRGDPAKDKSRLATTYYHREGPVGRVMERFNWFPGKENSNTYWADKRIPASLVLAGAADAVGTAFPMTELVTAWSEPPIATIGLGTGTMASYGRPYQHVHFYEIDNQILRFSLAVPTREISTYDNYKKQRDEVVGNDPKKDTFFNYLEGALERGSSVQVLMGDARLRMALPYKNHYETFQRILALQAKEKKGKISADETKLLEDLRAAKDDGGGPQGFYHMMVVDAFSSDAIPAHLLTEEAFRMYFEHLTEDGILCVHTSNRFVELPKVVAAITAKLKFAQLRGHDADTDRPEGHYTSEWVMVARKAEYLNFGPPEGWSNGVKRVPGDSDFLERYKQKRKGKPDEMENYWQAAPTNNRYLWTDDYYNLLSVVRFRPRRDDD